MVSMDAKGHPLTLVKLWLVPSYALLFAAAAAAQTAAPAPAKPAVPKAKAPVHRVVHRAAVPCPPAEPAPVTPAGLPPAPGAVQTAFALRYVDMKEGVGPAAQAGQTITVHYTGWLAANGTKFDSSYDHGAPGQGEPFTFPLGAHRVIPGWDNGVAGMKVGGKRRLFIPYQLAYGEDGRLPVIPMKADLIFDVELVSIDSPAQSELPTMGPRPPAGASPQ